MATENAMGNGAASEWEPNEEGEVLPNPEHARASERPSHMCITVLVPSASSCNKKTFSCTCIRVYIVRAQFRIYIYHVRLCFSCIDIRTFLLREHASTHAWVLACSACFMSVARAWVLVYSACCMSVDSHSWCSRWLYVPTGSQVSAAIQEQERPGSDHQQNLRGVFDRSCVAPLLWFRV
jgi:hypothetical protein